MKILRTPDSRFKNIKDFPYEPNYTVIKTHDDSDLRIHHIDEGPKDGPILLVMHGQPVWSYLYSRMIPYLTDAGIRIIAPDLPGYGKSDKPASREDYSYANHILGVEALLKKLDLKNIIFFAQDWGGLIGLRLLAKYPELYDGLVVSNSGLPVGSGATEGFMQWLDFSQNVEDFDCGKIVNQGSLKQLSEAEIAAYNAPFPDDSYKAGPRVFPTLVPITKEHPQVQENIEAWQVLSSFDKPSITLFGEHDMAFIG